MKPFVKSDSEDQPQIIYACAHWRSFPPPYASSGFAPEELRKNGYIGESDYQRMLVWKRVCGLQEMVPDKCLNCEHLRIAEIKKGLPVLTTTDGSHSVPAVDLPTLELNAARMKHHLRIRPPGKVPGELKGGS